MEWEGREESSNVEDRRGFSTQQMGVAGGLGAIVVVVLTFVFGMNKDQAQQIVNKIGVNQPQKQGENKRPLDPKEERLYSFSKVIFHDTEVVWDKQFANLGKSYKKPTLVVFTEQVQSGCGLADSGVGPFYCPADEKVYIDLAFYTEMERKLNAPGEFARAYVLAHEVGHHVQKQLGYTARADESRGRYGNDSTETNKMSVRIELQADFLAGVWAHHGQEKYRFLHEGDIESALNAANQIGDDTLQKRATGRVKPDSFTHGTSKQRIHWFKEGFDSGDLKRARELFDLPYNEL